MDGSWVKVQSSVINSVQYDIYTNLLFIQFNTGRVYQYGNVTPAIYAAFLEYKSKGQFFIHVIKKQGFPFKRIR